MAHLSAVLLASALALPVASPETSPLEGAFGNTILSTYPNGATAKLFLNRDGSYTSAGRKNEFNDGRWSIRLNKVCFQQSHPIPIPFVICRPLVAPAIGDRWTARAVTGEMLVVTLLAGRPASAQSDN